MVRAKVAALRWQQDQTEEARQRFVRHLRWASERLDRPPGTLLLMCGLTRAGKSHVGESLVPRLPAIRIRSDVARKTLSGLSPLTSTGSSVGEGIYHPSRSDEVFAAIAEFAEALLLSGEHVIIDATFIEKSRRVAFLSLAERLNVKAKVVYCRAPINVLRQRIQKRSESNQDPSEANLAVLEAQLKTFQPPGNDEPVIEIATDKPISDARLHSLVAAVIA
jgi:predicted kinase